MPSQLTWNLRGRTILIGTSDPPTKDVSCQIIVAGPTEEPQIQTVPATACADPRREITSVITNLALTALADWDDATGLAWFLHDHDRQTVWIQLSPGTGKAGWKASVTALQPPWDAGAEAPHQWTLSLPVLTLTKTKPT